MTEIPVKVNKPVDINGSPEVYLQQKSFDSLIQRKGYKVYIDRFMPCPCKEEGVESHLLTCKNCFGTGFVLVEREQATIFLHSMNRETQYKDWSMELIGTASITPVSEIVLSFMDRIVLYEEEIIYSDLIYPINTESGDIIAFCSYPPKEILNVFMYQGDNKELLSIDKSLIKIDSEGRLNLNEIRDILYSRQAFIYNKKTTLSIRYKFLPSYHIIDINRSVMTSPTDTFTNGIGNRGDRAIFPHSYIGRMSHLVLDRSNFINTASGYISNVQNIDSKPINQLNDKNISKVFCDTENK